MTTPIDPGDTGALKQALDDAMQYALNKGWVPTLVMEHAASAVARAVCPPGHHVIADDDLRAVVALAEPMVTPLTEDDALLDRLWAAIGDEE